MSLRTRIALVVVLLAPVALASAKKPKAKAPVVAPAQSEDQLKPLLADYQKPGADPRTLTDRFKPTHDDLVAVLDPSALARAEAYYTTFWSKDVIAAKPGETEVQLHKATSDDLLAGTPPSREFPLGWRAAAKAVKKGLTFYSLRFVNPTTKESTLFDAFVSVNGHFVFLPKMWLATK